MSDPTGTTQLRRSFLAEGNRRLAQLRSQTFAVLVKRDLMAARGDALAIFLPADPGHRLKAFADWFERSVEYTLLGGWWERFLQRAYTSGAVAGSELVGVPPPPVMRLPDIYRTLAEQEFRGIAASMAQQVLRQAAAASLGQLKPALLYREVLAALQKTGQVKVKLLVNTMTVQLHNAARLAVFREAGIARVGVDPERLEPVPASRFARQHDHAHDHFSDETRQQREARRAANVVERERERLQTALERGRESGELLERTESVAKAELRAAKIRVKRGRPRGRRLGKRITGPFVTIETAGDDLVCRVCENLAANSPYVIGVAEALLPVHPNCRCSFVPLVEEDDGEEDEDE